MISTSASQWVWLCRPVCPPPHFEVPFFSGCWMHLMRENIPRPETERMSECKQTRHGVRKENDMREWGVSRPLWERVLLCKTRSECA